MCIGINWDELGVSLGELGVNWDELRLIVMNLGEMGVNWVKVD